MSSISSLVYIQQYLTRYGITTYTILGNIGLLFNIAIFIQPQNRRNSSSLYILAASLSALLGLNFSVVSVIYGVDHPDPVITSLIFCLLQFYFRHIFNQMMRTFFVLTCAERYAILSGNRCIRALSKFKTTIYIIPSVMLLWFLLAIFPVMELSIVNGICSAKDDLSNILYSSYILIVSGILPLFFMTIFCILLIISLKKIRARIQPMTNTDRPRNQLLRKRDRDMLKMLLIEIMCYTITTTPFTVMLIYNAAAQKAIKSNERQQIESFTFYFFGTFLLYINNSLSFWIYISTSQSFRLQFKNLIMKCYAFITGKQIRINEIN
jgi:hypothetical protein